MNVFLFDADKFSLVNFLDFPINIPQGIGAKYELFGIALLNDENGTLVETIKKEKLGKCEDINNEIIASWIRKNNPDLKHGWETLTDAIRKAGLIKLADDIDNEVKKKTGNY